MNTANLRGAGKFFRQCGGAVSRFRREGLVIRCAVFLLAVVLLLATAAGPSWAAAAAGTGGKQTPSIRLFGSIQFRGPLKNVPLWLDVIKRNARTPVFTPGSKLNRSTTWDALKAQLEDKPPMEQLKLVNRFWNQWPYRLDPEVYGKEDYWAIPDQFRKNSGDCEDYAIAKYYTLRELGFKPEQMRIVVLMDTIRNLAHAVLVVYLDGDAWVLNNITNSVLSHTTYKNYVPQFSVNEQYRWAHVRPK